MLEDTLRFGTIWSDEIKVTRYNQFVCHGTLGKNKIKLKAEHGVISFSFHTFLDEEDIKHIPETTTSLEKYFLSALKTAETDDQRTLISRYLIGEY